MTLIKASLRNQQVSPKKMRLVLNLVRGKTADLAKNQLLSLDKKGAKIAYRLLKSALDAAKNKQLKENDLYISEFVCNEGRKLKRFYVRARGRTSPFRKRSAHLRIGLDQIKKEGVASKNKKVVPIAEQSRIRDRQKTIGKLVKKEEVKKDGPQS